MPYARQRTTRAAETLRRSFGEGLIYQKVAAAGQSITLDPARLAGLGAAVVALLARAPFLVVIVVAAGTAALLRLAWRQRDHLVP